MRLMTKHKGIKIECYIRGLFLSWGLKKNYSLSMGEPIAIKIRLVGAKTTKLCLPKGRGVQ
jgi:hypothetical protein